ncbi:MULTISPECIES: FliK family flagellar hook-length control protein [Lacticaseibacillus]|uniref:FliK family flagellar hook-length control protein n=2 Tax=Lacticaseibacillus TaxID=2759736 RepID=A0AAN1F157_LACCA|nr:MULTISPECIES: FliK family flagellar hook-length control protein [Lacticaseibacillus]ARY92823.1 FliK family flagellar hook-length control protein [Lacticaseibacillus casei]KAB1970151.1 FliK family flagellar hook-length control protein [Lacticaseibacillus casei]WLV80726.1 FliK family flagellar hook-length control protein [Lacticaseibacillus sp. NCIMB 15473]WNX24686.1 FliK family flagellar hook-length control protein [Lacticaseibacillus casei]WNX27458.1 FliK family flagellar hook-length contro
MKQKHIFQILVGTLIAGYLTVFYGMRSTIDTSFAQHAVQAATQQTNQLYTSAKRTFPAKHLSRAAVTSTQEKLKQLANNVDDRKQKKTILKDKQDADAASYMLTIEETTKAQSSNLAQLAEDGSQANKAYKAIASTKPEFAADYQQSVSQLYRKSLAISQIQKLYKDQNLQHPKSDLSSSSVDLAVNAVENVENQDFAKNVLPLVQVARKSQESSDSNVAMGNTTSSGQSTQKQAATANSSEPASGVGKKDNSSSQAPTSSASQSNQTSQSSSTATSSSSSSKSDNQTQPSSDPTASSSLEPMTTVLSGGLYKTYDDAVAAIKVQGKSVDDMTVKSVTMSDGSYQWTWGPTGDSGSSSNKTSASSSTSSSAPTTSSDNAQSSSQDN